MVPGSARPDYFQFQKKKLNIFHAPAWIRPLQNKTEWTYSFYSWLNSFCIFVLGDRWVEEAINRWNRRHMFRTVINALGAGCTIWATVSSTWFFAFLKLQSFFLLFLCLEEMDNQSCFTYCNCLLWIPQLTLHVFFSH